VLSESNEKRSILCLPQSGKQAMRDARSRGGRANTVGVSCHRAEYVSLRSYSNCMDFLKRLINDVGRAVVPLKVATTQGFLLTLHVKALEKQEFERQLNLVEKILEIRKLDESLFDPDKDEEESA